MDWLARFGRCLADPRAVGILALALEEGDLCACEIQQALRLTRHQLERALAKLREAEVVSFCDRGPCRIVSLDPAAPDVATALLDQMGNLIAQDDALESAVRRLRDGRRRGAFRHGPRRLTPDVRRVA